MNHYVLTSSRYIKLDRCSISVVHIDAMTYSSEDAGTLVVAAVDEYPVAEWANSMKLQLFANKLDITMGGKMRESFKRTFTVNSCGRAAPLLVPVVGHSAHCFFGNGLLKRDTQRVDPHLSSTWKTR